MLTQITLHLFDFEKHVANEKRLAAKATAAGAVAAAGQGVELTPLTKARPDLGPDTVAALQEEATTAKATAKKNRAGQTAKGLKASMPTSKTVVGSPLRTHATMLVRVRAREGSRMNNPASCPAAILSLEQNFHQMCCALLISPLPKAPERTAVASNTEEQMLAKKDGPLDAIPAPTFVPLPPPHLQLSSVKPPPPSEHLPAAPTEGQAHQDRRARVSIARRLLDRGRKPDGTVTLPKGEYGGESVGPTLRCGTQLVLKGQRHLSEQRPGGDLLIRAHASRHPSFTNRLPAHDASAGRPQSDGPSHQGILDGREAVLSGDGRFLQGRELRGEWVGSRPSERVEGRVHGKLDHMAHTLTTFGLANSFSSAV